MKDPDERDDHRSASGEADPEVTLRLRGSACWSRPDGAGGPLGRLDAAWLALACCSPGFARERAAAWLWPEAPLKAAQTNLRQHVFKLRQLTGHALLQPGPTLLAAQGLSSDTAPAAPTRGGGVEETILLGGFDFGDLEALDAWVHDARERLRRGDADALAARVATQEAQGALAAALEDCAQLVALAPTQERSWRQWMRLHYLRGDRSAAIATFERFERDVCQEWGMRPAPETLALLDTIERSQAAAPAARRPLPAALVRPPRLVGREAAWAAVHAAWDAARPALVLGEGGIGKSRLLEELVQAWPEPQAVVHVSARPGDASAPYTTLSALLAQGWARVPAEALAPPYRAELARVLPELGPPPPGRGHQGTLWRAAEALLCACGPRLQLISVDDLHHADPASLEFLRWALASPALAPLRWLLAARPEPAGDPRPPAVAGSTTPWPAWLGDSTRIEPVVLSRLDGEALDALLDSLGLAEGAPTGREARAALLQHAGGHPFFTLETLKALWLQGAKASGWPLPPAAGAMLARRIGGLSLEALTLLRAHSLAPGALHGERATALLQVPQAVADGAQTELEAAQLANGGAPAHDLVREQVLGAWPAASRAPLALRLATLLQDDPGVPAARKAALWQQAHAPGPAAEALEALALAAGRAGRLAERADLNRQAATLWREAGRTGAAFDAELRAAQDGLLLHGSPATLERCQALLGEADSATRRADVLVLQANAHLNAARYADALTCAEAALDAAPAHSATAQDAATLHGRAMALTGRAVEAVALLTQAAAAAQARLDTQDTSGDRPPALARALIAQGALAHALQVAGRLGEAADRQQRALQLALESGDATEIAQNTSNLATLLSTVGRPRAALHAARDADQRLQSLGVADAHWVFNRVMLARCAAHEGALDEALAAVDSAMGRAEAVGPSMATMLRIQRYAVLEWLGQPDPALLPVSSDAMAALSPLAQAGVLLAVHRRLRATGAGRTEREPIERALAQLALAQPALREDPVLAREWCRIDPAPEALGRLRRLAERAREVAAPGVARSLDLVAVARLREVDPSAATALALTLLETLQDGVHPATLPPQAWGTLKSALPPGAARDRAQAAGLAWLHAARLPARASRDTFLRAHAVWFEPAIAAP